MRRDREAVWGSKEHHQRPMGWVVRAAWLLLVLIVVAGCPPKPAHRPAPKGRYPGLLHYAAPDPAPPAPGDKFFPDMGGPAGPATPAAAEWTRTAGPDETVLLTGQRLSGYVGDDYGRDTEFAFYDGTAAPQQPQLQHLAPDKALLIMPQAAARWGMYLVWPGNKAGYGAPIALNQTEAWWVGPEKAPRGATVAVYGRNLAHHNDTLAAYVLLKPRRGAGQWAAVTRVNPYRVAFKIPAGLATGDYEVWTHNGHGGQYGWSDPLKLTIQEDQPWSGPRLNVKSYGATGDGRTDDTPALTKALAAARQSAGATVYFPAGTYLVSNTLEPGSNTRWQGDGRTRTVLQCAPTFAAGAEAMVRGSAEHVELRDLAFAGNHNYRGSQPEPIFMRGSKDLRLTNVLFSFQDYNVLQLDNAYGVYIANCEFIGKTSFLGHASQLFIDRCQFKLTNDAEMALDSWGGHDISLTNSTCQDYDNTDPTNGAGWGKGRFYAGRGNFGSSRHTYIGDNRTIDLAVRPVGTDQNSGEQFMWEGYTTDWAGPVATSTDTVTTLSGFSTPYDNSHYAIITKGTGQGQARRISAYRGNAVVLATPWHLRPDATSVVALAKANDRAVLYHNSLDGKAYAVASAEHNASAGIEPYGATLNFIAAHNLLHELRVGIANWATQNQTEIDPNLFGMYVANVMADCRWGILNGLYMSKPKEGGLFGTTYRRNSVHHATQSAVTNIITAPATGLVMSYFIYEHNTLQSAANGFSLGGEAGLPPGFPASGKGIANHLFYKNSVKSTGTVTASGIQSPAASWLRANSLSGGARSAARPAPTTQLEAPYRVVRLRTPSQSAAVPISLTFWQSGTYSLAWQAFSSAPWLTLTTAKGSLPAEAQAGAITASANPKGLSAGEHVATVAVVAGQHVLKYTVHLTVAATSAAATNQKSSKPAN